MGIDHTANDRAVRDVAKAHEAFQNHFKLAPQRLTSPTGLLDWTAEKGDLQQSVLSAGFDAVDTGTTMKGVEAELDELAAAVNAITDRSGTLDHVAALTETVRAHARTWNSEPEGADVFAVVSPIEDDYRQIAPDVMKAAKLVYDRVMELSALGGVVALAKMADENGWERSDIATSRSDDGSLSIDMDLTIGRLPKNGKGSE